MNKICVRCNEEKEIDLFSKGKSYKDGRRGVCKRCHTDYMLNYYKNNPDKKANKVKMNTYYKPNWKRHNITEEKYKSLLLLHNGLCHGCKAHEARNIDHNHQCCSGPFSCGKCVRGLLCRNCNFALGLMQDDVSVMLSLIDYIR
jgi:hypothetical protein